MSTPLPTAHAPLRHIDLDGATPNGHAFTIRVYHNLTGIVARALLWHPFDGVGSISVPMHAECWAGQLYYELTRLGRIGPETARNCFAT